MRKWISVVLVVALAIVVVNDVSRYISVVTTLDSITDLAVGQAAVEARSHPDDPGPGRRAAEAITGPAGVIVTGYEQTQGMVTIWTEHPVEGTLILRYVNALAAGRSAEDTFTVQNSATRVRP